VSDVTQPSLFSADTLPPDVTDLGGLLAAHGQVAAGPGGARLSILLGEPWRAEALADECARRGIAAQALSADRGADPGGASTLLRTDRTDLLAGVAADWTRGAVKAAPTGLVAGAGMLRVWLIAAGRHTPAGYALGLEPHARDTHGPLAAACARAGLTGAVVGGASDAPVIRLTGRKRLGRLLELVGAAPPGAPGQAWPARGA
jgi:hypothetical protein